MPVQPRHRLDVVIEDVGPRVEHGAKRRFVSLEVWDQHFEPAFRRRARVSTMVRAKCEAPKSGEVVAIDRRHDHVVETERMDRARRP